MSKKPLHFTVSELLARETENGSVTLWRIQGLNDAAWFPNKIVAEAAARVRFPDEHPETRYARIRFTVFSKGEIQ